MEHRRAIVLHSGGIDSTVALALACWEYDEVHPLALYYGQRHANEIQCAADIADAVGLTLLRQTIDASVWTRHPLAAAAHDHLERGRHADEIRAGGIPRAFLPARNMVFVCYAIAHAAMLGGGDVIVGATATDATGFPDCRAPFFAAMDAAAREALPDDHRVRVLAPLARMTKGQVVALGRRMGVDFAQTWSCYRPVYALEGPKPCAACDACVLRAEAMREADTWDRLTGGVA